MAAIIRDTAGKPARIRRAVSPGAEYCHTLDGHHFWVDPRTGAYYAVVCTPLVLDAR